MIVVYLKNVGGGGDDCWVVCAKGDSGAVAFEGFPPSEYWEREVVKAQAHRERIEKGSAPPSQDRA